MKIVQINTVAGIGSTGRIVSSIAKTVKDNGGEAYVAYGHGRAFSEKDYLVGSAIEKRIHAHFFSTLLDRHGLGSQRGTVSCIDWMRTIQPDIIHIHNLHGNYINYRLLFSFLKDSGIPVVWTVHDCWPITGHCTHFDNTGCRKWIEGCYHCPLLHDYPRSLFIDNSANNYSLKKRLFLSVKNLTIVPVSFWLGGIIKDSFLKEKAIIPIHNGIDLNVFAPNENSSIRSSLLSRGQSLILGVSSSWGPLKGLDEFVELSKNPYYKIVLVGVPEAIRSKLPKEIVSYERTDSREELASLYASADVLVNPTYNDSFPTINLESLACGTPVVTYRTGGSPESVDGKTGIVVEKGDIKALMAAIREVIEKGKSFYSPFCRAKAESDYDQNKCYQQYLSVYHDILQK